MPAQSPPELAAKLRKISRALDRWRRQGRSPRRIPDEIWDQAMAVAAVHGVGPVAKELHLDHAKLKSLLAGKTPQALIATRTPEPPVPATFFELLAPPQTCKSLGQCILSLESSCGGRMRVEVSDLDATGLALLVREFVS